MATNEDVDMVDVQAQGTTDYTDLLQTHHTDAFAFGDIEKRALQLYDQLLELELEHSLLLAQSGMLNQFLSSILYGANLNAAQDFDEVESFDGDLQEQLVLAEREAMEAKVEYEIRNRITHSVLVMDPVLKA